jgi:hypothetical protein
VDEIQFLSIAPRVDEMRNYGRMEIALYVVEAESHVMTELDARQCADARLLADPCFRDGKVFGELLGGEEVGKSALGARGAPKDQLGDDV